jgi:hypothetical protein
MMRHAEQRSHNGRFAGYPKTLPVVIGDDIGSDVEAKGIVQPKRLFLRLLEQSAPHLVTGRGLDQHLRTNCKTGYTNSVTQTIFSSKPHAFNRLDGND